MLVWWVAEDWTKTYHRFGTLNSQWLGLGPGHRNLLRPRIYELSVMDENSDACRNSVDLRDASENGIMVWV